jgi:hypothetical protein
VLWLPFLLSLPLAIASLVAAGLRPSGRTLLAGAIGTVLVPVSFFMPWVLTSLID